MVGNSWQKETKQLEANHSSMVDRAQYKINTPNHPIGGSFVNCLWCSFGLHFWTDSNRLSNCAVFVALPNNHGAHWSSSSSSRVTAYKLQWPLRAQWGWTWPWPQNTSECHSRAELDWGDWQLLGLGRQLLQDKLLPNWNFQVQFWCKWSRWLGWGKN